MSHFLWECNHLGPEQTALEETLTRFVLDNGGIQSANLGPIPTLQWKDMSDTGKFGLLMGNHTSVINHISMNTQSSRTGELLSWKQQTHH
jgi:hypothetical protein